jgi:hypothetical protein
MRSVPNLTALGPGVQWKEPHDVHRDGPGEHSAHSRVVVELGLDGASDVVSLDVSVPVLSHVIPEVHVGSRVDRSAAMGALAGVLQRTSDVVSGRVCALQPTWRAAPVRGARTAREEDMRVTCRFVGTDRGAWNALQVQLAGWLQRSPAIDELSIVALRQERDRLRVELEWHRRRADEPDGTSSDPSDPSDPLESSPSAASRAGPPAPRATRTLLLPVVPAAMRPPLPR